MLSFTSQEISFEDAKRRILAAFAPLPIEATDIRDALRAVLAEPLVARSNLPAFTNSAMDGYAVFASDIAGASPEHPVELPVVASVAAGAAGNVAISPGAAARIMTGAPLPNGADAVVPFELTELISPGRVRMHAALPPWANVRAAGEDARAGDTILPAGTRVRPAEIALLASLGETTARVRRRPRVAVLATGDEIVEPGAALKPGQIWDANSAAIAAMIQELGGVAIPAGIARDAAPELIAKLRAAAELGVDLLISSGGVSAGDFDLVKRVLREQGDVHIWRVRMRPGRPLAFGKIGAMPVLGLPGNPVATAVAFLQFARPAILSMLGVPADHRELTAIPVRVLDAIENRGGRRNFVRVLVRAAGAGFTAELAGPQGSANLAAFAKANGLLVIPEEMERVQPGQLLMAQMPGWPLD